MIKPLPHGHYIDLELSNGHHRVLIVPYGRASRAYNVVIDNYLSGMLNGRETVLLYNAVFHVQQMERPKPGVLDWWAELMFGLPEENCCGR